MLCGCLVDVCINVRENRKRSGSTGYILACCACTCFAFWWLLIVFDIIWQRRNGLSYFDSSKQNNHGFVNSNAVKEVPEDSCDESIELQLPPKNVNPCGGSHTSSPSDTTSASYS